MGAFERGIAYVIDLILKWCPIWHFLGKFVPKMGKRVHYQVTLPIDHISISGLYCEKNHSWTKIDLPQMGTYKIAINGVESAIWNNLSWLFPECGMLSWLEHNPLPRVVLLFLLKSPPTHPTLAVKAYIFAIGCVRKYGRQFIPWWERRKRTCNEKLKSLLLVLTPSLIVPWNWPSYLKEYLCREFILFI